MVKKSRLITQLTFLKLGGSLITEKTVPRTPRPEVLTRLAQEIAEARDVNPALRLLLGHGSGSFGHMLASQYATRQGVNTPEQWRGFAEVWWDAASLNRLVVEALREAGLPAISFPPSASVTACDGQVGAWEFGPICAALNAGLLPVVQGDVIFDTVRGGTILSTEELFAHLARHLKPSRLLLAGNEPGVWKESPDPAAVTSIEIIPEITPTNFIEILPTLGGSQATDVTGGMASKVKLMLALVHDLPGLEVMIFSGKQPGLVQRALLGENEGTKIRV